LVIDNCEHVLDAAADLIEAILVHSATAGPGHQPRSTWDRPGASAFGPLAGLCSGNRRCRGAPLR
jgi:hypothetical protein